MTTQSSSQLGVPRRAFLRRGCLTAAAIGVTVCGGGAAIALYQPAVDQPSTQYGEKTMEKRVLVAYATKAGSTAEVATKIGEMIAKQNTSVDVLPIAKVGDISQYQAVVLGSVIRMGRVLPEVQKFVETHQAVFSQKPLSVFITCMTLQEDTPAKRQEVVAYLDPLRAVVKPASEGLFAGVMNPNKVNLIERLMMSAMKVPQGDFRNWDEITAWAQAVPTSLN